MHTDWRFILNIIGLSSITSAIVSWWLGSIREHRRWVLDNKKLEWRELIDTLNACMHNVGYAFQTIRTYTADGEGDVNRAIQKGFGIIRDRFFIAEAIERYKVLEQWRELVKYAVSATVPGDPKQEGAPTEVGFDQKAREFEDKLLAIAREDLKVRSLFSSLTERLRLIGRSLRGSR